METIKNYRDLIVWQKAMKLAKSLYQHTTDFPVVERYGLVSQTRRAAVSIPSNIAEGHARNSKGEYKQSIGMSKGSLAELETQIILSGELAFMGEESVKELLNQCSEVGKLLNGLLRSLR